jgi:hypothetical protein
VILGHAMIETVNAANLVDVLDSKSDPYLRDATRLLLADEVKHASFGFDYLAAWHAWLMRGRRCGPRSTAGSAAPSPSSSGRGAAPGCLRRLPPDQMALGIPDPARLTVVLHQTVEGAIVPALEGFGLDAATSWRKRAPDA